MRNPGRFVGQLASVPPINAAAFAAAKERVERRARLPKLGDVGHGGFVRIGKGCAILSPISAIVGSVPALDRDLEVGNISHYETDHSVDRQ